MNLRLRDLAFLALGVAIAVALPTEADTELFGEIGQCRFGTAPSPTFYNADLRTSNYMHPGCFAVGLQDKWNGSERFGWRAWFESTGSIQARDNMATNDERVADPNRPPCTPPNEDGCFARFNGSGQTQGLGLTLTAEQPLFEHLSVIGEAGILFFQHHFKAEGRFVGWGNNPGRAISYNESSKLWDLPSPVAGVTLRYRDVYFAFRHYWPTGHRALTLTNNERNNFMLGWVAARWK